MKILVTGNCGFIGQNFVRMYKNQHEIIGLDCMAYASDHRATKLCKTYPYNLCDKEAVESVFVNNQFDAIVNFAAESHVDNSIVSPEPFIYGNIIGTFNLLEMARQFETPKYLQVSTDETYGDLGPNDPVFSNDNELRPSSPYSASKASADLLVQSYHKTYGLNTIITRSSNNYGPFQHKEKFIPVVISNALKNKKIPLYGNGKNIREWLYVGDNCRGIMSALLQGKSGETYNIGSGFELENIEIIKKILKILNKPETLIEFVTDRKGHDRRYAINSQKINNFWKPIMDFDTGIQKTIDWYINHPNYWEEECAE